MALKAYADSVFAQSGQWRAGGVGLRRVLQVLAALAVVPLVLLLGLAWHAAFGAPGSRQLGLLALGIAAFLALYVALIGVLGLRWVIRPLRDLVTQMRQIELGHYERADIEHSGGGVREVQLLHRGLHAMWHGLERRRRERDDALAASHAAREKMHVVLEEMDEGFLILDTGWNVKFCNPRGAQMLRQPADGVEGMRFWDLFPDDEERGRRERCQREVEHGRAATVEDFHARYKRWFEIRFFPSEAGIGVFLRDVTQRRQLMDELVEREQRYRELFEANPNVMWIFDAETLKFLAVNQAAIDHYGYRLEEFLAMDITDIRPAEDRQDVIDEVRQSLDHGSHTLHDRARIWRHVTKKGEVVLVEVARHPILFQGRQARLVMVNDVTARLMSESRLRGRHEKLAAQHSQANRELRASQQVVAGCARLMGDEVLPLLSKVGAAPDPALARQAQALEQMLREVQQLAQLPHTSFQPEPVDLAELAQAEVQRLRLAQPERRFHVEIEPQLLCQGDAVLLRRLLHALLDNAWKFSARQRNPWIRMGRLEREDGAVAAFYISDNGVGFDEALQGRLYLPFERLHSDAEYAGHGLGLAVARAIVARHSGRLWAQSSPGQGATFCFELEPVPEDGQPRVTEVVIDSVEE